MKILSLIELTRGTGISQYLSSFAMIEGENVMILDTNKHSILDGLLGIDDTSTQNNRYGKHSYCNNKNCYEMDIYFGRFHNLYLRCLQFTEQPSVDLINNMAQSIKAHSSFRNCRYLLIYFPFRDDFNGIKEIISNSDYSVIFSDGTSGIINEFRKFMKTEPERKNCVGFVHTKTERVYADTKELELIQTEPLGILPYNLLIQNATIKNKVVLEFDDRNRQEDTIRNVWDKIKNRVGV